MKLCKFLNPGMLLSNRVGKEGSMEFCGKSMIVNPFGEIIANAGGEEDTIVTALLKMEEVNEARHRLPFTRDLRPEIYREICSEID